MSRIRDEVSVWNERIKLLAGFVNAMAIGLVGFAVLRPATEDVALISTASLLWAGGGLGMHLFAHYMLGYLRKEAADDDL